MFAGKNTATASHLVTIDPESGAIGDLMETFYYAGSRYVRELTRIAVLAVFNDFY